MTTLSRISFIAKLRSLKLCLEAHPDNEPYSEFEDRISDCEEMITFLQNDDNFKQ